MAGLQLVAAQRSQVQEISDLLRSATPFDAASTVADEKLFVAGPAASVSAVCAHLGETLVGIAACSERWLRLLAVHPEYTQRGIGSALLQWAQDRGAVRTLDQPGNYLAPGIDVRNQHAIAWLQKRGFSEIRRNQNLIVPLEENAAADPKTARAHCARLAHAGYQLHAATIADLPELAATIARDHSAAWAHEVSRALRVGGVFLVRDAERNLAGFAAHDGNNAGLGWFGPAATCPGHQGRGIGAALLVHCLNEIRENGHRRAEIAWNGPAEFYRKVCGEVTAREFVVLATVAAENR